jgi:hypothetical protein
MARSQDARSTRNIKGLQQGAGETGSLIKSGYFERRSHRCLIAACFVTEVTWHGPFESHPSRRFDPLSGKVIAFFGARHRWRGYNCDAGAAFPDPMKRE